MSKKIFNQVLLTQLIFSFHFPLFKLPNKLIHQFQVKINNPDLPTTQMLLNTTFKYVYTTETR